uniref:Zf-C3Hc3H domain-containing protein n=1 Tax=Meloidogyne hapla TaxID=6305 RepID=A0A1I8BR86_MELHA
MDTLVKSEISKTIEILNATNSMTVDTPLSSNPDSANDEHTHIDVHNNPSKLNAHFCEHTDQLKGQALCTNAIRSASSEIYCSTHLIMKGLKDPKLSRKDSKLNNNPDTFYPLADRLLKSPTRQLNIEPSASYLPEIRSHQNQNLTEYDFPGPTFSNSLSSSLYFINSEKIPRHYDIDRLEQKLAAETEDENELVKFQRDYVNDFDANFSTLKRKQKVIKLRQKRQKVRIDGVFRKVRAVDTMCRVVESYDFDWTDLFPLGLEPSDDESSSDDSFPSFDEDLSSISNSLKNSIIDNKHSRNRLELYLLKKKLRLESARLVQRAKLCIPINMAAKHYVNYTGAALRIRKVNKGRGNFEGKIKENRFKRCAQMLQHQITRDGKRHLFNARCQSFCLPWAVYCADHIAYSVAQQLFAYCKWRFCNAAVSVVDGDVSLASVAKDLGFDGRELTDMLERLPVEEAFEGEMEADDENFLNGVNKDDSDEVPPGISLGHSWADVEQFLLEQEQQSISDESTPQF